MHPGFHELAVLAGRILAERRHRRHGKTNLKSADSMNDNGKMAEKTSIITTPVGGKK